MIIADNHRTAEGDSEAFEKRPTGGIMMKIMIKGKFAMMMRIRVIVMKIN